MKSLSFRKDLIGVQEELLRFAYKLTANREEANDLLQETSLKALDNEDKYVPDTNFKGWMYTIMRNIFINNYRKIVRDQTFVDQTDNLYHFVLEYLRPNLIYILLCVDIAVMPGPALRAFPFSHAQILNICIFIPAASAGL